MQKPKWYEDLQTFMRNWEDVVKWDTLALSSLVIALLLFGSYLMFQSVYHLTGDIFLAFLSPAFTELGILAYSTILNSTGRTIQGKTYALNKEQIAIAQQGQYVHIGASIILMSVNMLLENARGIIGEIIESFGYKVDGLGLIVYLVLALVMCYDVIQYYRFKYLDTYTKLQRDANYELMLLDSQKVKDELGMKRKEHETMLTIESEKQRVQLESELEFTRKTAPKFWQLAGKLQSANKIRDLYKSLGLSKQQVDSILAGLDEFDDNKIFEKEDLSNQNPT